LPLCIQIYSASVSVFLGGNKPSRTGNVRGDISINFSCDPAISAKLVSCYSCILFLVFGLIIQWPICSLSSSWYIS